MKIAKGPIENKGLSSNRAIFMQGGEPKDHGIFAQDGSQSIFLRLRSRGMTMSASDPSAL
jgi:hypothetical protein